MARQHLSGLLRAVGGLCGFKFCKASEMISAAGGTAVGAGALHQVLAIEVGVGVALSEAWVPAGCAHERGVAALG